MRSRSRRCAGAPAISVGLVGALLGAGCSGGDSDEVAREVQVTVVDTTSESVLTDDVFTSTDTDDLGPVPPPIPTDVQVSDSVLDPIEPVPDTGVPGIESDDVFCRSWSEFAGSYQALTFAWAIQPPDDAARLEVVATDVLSRSVEQLGASLPPELDAERQALTVDLPGPILRRAQRAREILLMNGQDEAAVVALGELWLSAVTEQGLETETLSVPIGDFELNGTVEKSALMLMEELPPITEDPSLVVDVAIPLTEQYLFDNCPDRGVLAGADNVDPS